MARLEFDDVTADVLQLIPVQRAGDLAAATPGLVNMNNRWVGVNGLTLESTAVPGVHVLGDATFSAPAMPKAATWPAGMPRRRRAPTSSCSRANRSAAQTIGVFHGLLAAAGAGLVYGLRADGPRGPHAPREGRWYIVRPWARADDPHAPREGRWAWTAGTA